jgi:hypothetical protein
MPYSSFSIHSKKAEIKSRRGLLRQLLPQYFRLSSRDDCCSSNAPRLQQGRKTLLREVVVVRQNIG